MPANTAKKKSHAVSNKDRFVYEDSTIRINYPALLLARGPLPVVEFTGCHADGLRVSLAFRPCLDAPKARPDDVVHIYAVEFNVEVCELVASVERQSGRVAFDLPDLGDETSNPIVFHLYAIVEAANTACTPTLSADEKKSNKSHRNIDRRVSPSIFIGTVVLK